MKRLALLTIIFAASTSAFAGRAILNEENYAQILATGKQDMLRVYLSSKLTLEKSSSETLIDVATEKGTGLRKESNVEIERLVISKKIKGKIIEFRKETDRAFVYVSFDPSCQVKECALSYLSFGYKFFFHKAGSEFKDAEAKFGGIFGARDNYLTFNNEDFKNITKTTNFAPGFN